jgi:hypothetical protein
MTNKPTPPTENAFTLRTGFTAPGGSIGRDHILSKYWELANLDPLTTKGSITGQLKALDSLVKGLRQMPADKSKDSGKTVASQEIYRASWMADPRRTN